MIARRPQELVFSLYGEYLLDRGGPVWVGSLIHLLAPFGLSAGAVRTVLSRMTRRGWLRTDRRGRRSYYDLTDRGRKLLEMGAERIYHPPRHEPWDGSWHLVAYSIPEEQRELRDRFRVRLAWLGCGSLGGGLWISPHDIARTVGELAEDLGISDHVEVFRANHRGMSGLRQLIARCWNLGEIGRRYTEFIVRFGPAYAEDCAAKRAGRLASEKAFVRRFELIHAYREFPLVDPYLPRELLAHPWAGDRAAELFEEYHELLVEPADRWVAAVLEPESTGIAA